MDHDFIRLSKSPIVNLAIFSFLCIGFRFVAYAPHLTGKLSVVVANALVYDGSNMSDNTRNQPLLCQTVNLLMSM